MVFSAAAANSATIFRRTAVANKRGNCIAPRALLQMSQFPLLTTGISGRMSRALANTWFANNTSKRMQHEQKIRVRGLNGFAPLSDACPAHGRDFA